MKRQLRKPENWQDFESLCKILWGEIWNCPEIKKNGRNGQQQHGVDIYGIPENESKYYGIQCKGKDDYTNEGLSEKEIDQEIIKARHFKPTLKKFYFTTTANKNAKLEEYVRLKNEESTSVGSFEIHLFSWEDIVDLIDENKRTHDWYLNNIKYKTNQSVKVTFQNGKSELHFNPILKKNRIKYKNYQLNPNSILPPFNTESYEEKIKLLEPQPIRYYFNGMTFNKSSCVFNLLIKNDGNLPLEYIKMYLHFNGNIMVDTVNKQTQVVDLVQYTYNIKKIDDENNFVFEPVEQILLQTDSVSIDKICLRPNIEEDQEILIEYEFIAKGFNKNGYLKIHLKNEIIETESIKEHDFLFDKDEEIRIENYLEK